MTERLGKVAQLPPGVGIVLLREQTDIVREAGQPLEQPLRLVLPAQEDVVVDEPERTREER